jgi:anti-sigma factor RsiW
MTADVEQLSCRELVELVTDYFEDALPEQERARFEEHVGTCDGCRVYLEQMRLTLEALGHLPEQAVSPEAERVLLEAFRGWRSA